MKIYKNYSLKKHNGFAVEVNAKYFVVIEEEKDINLLLQEEFFQEEQKKYILGDGYNTIFAGDYDGVIIKNNILGIEKKSEDEEKIIFKVSSGENWHNFVKFTAENNYSGLEKLALIPGQVGAAPFQNIGAYGTEQKDAFLELEVINLETGEKKKFSKEECEFEYRNSFFKKDKNGHKFFITNVSYKLKKVDKIIPGEFYKSRYDSLKDFIDYQKPVTVLEIFNAMVNLRNSKLPEIEDWGTLGSIFINPVISKDVFLKVQKRFPEIQSYEAGKNEIHDLVKIPIGWILEELGWKNKWLGKVGTYFTHALLVVTKKDVGWEEVLDFIESMQKDVKKETGIELELEIRVVK